MLFSNDDGLKHKNKNKKFVQTSLTGRDETIAIAHMYN